MSIHLTEGAVQMLSTGDHPSSDIKPVFQIADVRLVNTSNQNNAAERYRILLSDGVYSMQGMLATQHNELVRSDKLLKGSIIQLTQFVCNLIQNRRIIIIVALEIIVEKCDLIGDPKLFQPNVDGNASPVSRSPTPGQPIHQPPAFHSPPSHSVATSMASSTPRPSMGGGIHAPHLGGNRNAGSSSYPSSFSSNPMNNPQIYPKPEPMNNPKIYTKPEVGSGVFRPPISNYGRPPQSSYQQPPSMYSNRGPIAKNDAPARIIPIAALNPYQGRWTIKARVTAKGELRQYNNARGDGKVFSFDLLDNEGGEIRMTCFNAVAERFYQQIELGNVYMISRGTLKPAQKDFNHLRNQYEIMLDNTSTVEPCFDDDQSIPKQQFHFRPISDIEGLENNSIIDVIAIVTSISPSSSIMRKNGTETQKRALQLKDMSARSVELTLWGGFCNAEGQNLQALCDSGVFPVLALKSGRVNDFNGKSIGSISTSQLFIDPDFPEAQNLRAWFELEGKTTPAISISRDTNMVRTEARKTIAQIKDEKLGTSDKPDWIMVSATLTFIKADNFCYTACPITVGDRQCNKKVTNNGDGKWRCDKCDQVVDECDYRYILQMQIQDHTGLTWVTAFQESGMEIMNNITAKELYYMKYEEQDDDKFSEIMRSVLFTKFSFKLKVKEEMFSDEQRVKSTVVKAEKVDFQKETKYLLGLIANLKDGDPSSVHPMTETVIRTPTVSGMTYGGINSNAGRQSDVAPSQTGGSYDYNNNNNNQYGGARFNSTGSAGSYMGCNSCGGTGHDAANCPSLMSAPGQSYGGGGGNRMTPGGGGGGGGSGECYNCHENGHWARDCPNNGGGGGGGGNRMTPGGGGGGSGECYKCHENGHWAKDCPNNGAPSYGGNSNVGPGRYGMAPKQHVGGL